jgi:hypothetical protein
MGRVVVPSVLADGPFDIRAARTAGVTHGQLGSRAYRRMFHGVWVSAQLPDTLDVRFEAARLSLPPHAVACDLTAAWLWGADVRRLDDLDVHASFAKGLRVRPQRGLVISQETLEPSDIQCVRGVLVTSAIRTVFDCLRFLRHPEGVVVADALTHDGVVTVRQIDRYFREHHRMRNIRIGRARVPLIEPLAESPMETRSRVAVVDAGLRPPESQIEVRSPDGRLLGRLDNGYRDVRYGFEYDGEAYHRERRSEDERRRDAMRRVGWDISVFSADDYYRHRERMLAEVAWWLRRKAAA